MAFSEMQLRELEKKVLARLSEKRVRHTLGVERAAVILAKKILPNKLSEIRAAALLHDITKEYTAEEHLRIMKSYRGTITESDFLASSVYHSLTAPYVIKKDFPEFAVPDILSAVRNHTTGSPDMSVFDEIIFIADYVEEGRTYPACIEVRERLFNFILRSQDAEECISFLHDAAIASLDNTIVSLIKRGDFLHEKTVMTRNAFLGRKPLALN